MATISELKKRLQELKMVEIADQAINDTSETFLDLNREQLMEGKRRDGTDISPSYFEDLTYFKSIDSATRYSEWKDRITPNPKRKKGVPNLYINGFFHNSIVMSATGEEIKSSSPFSGYDSIIGKFTDKIHGLDIEKRTIYIESVLMDRFMVLIRAKIKL